MNKSLVSRFFRLTLYTQCTRKVLCTWISNSVSRYTKHLAIALSHPATGISAGGRIVLLRRQCLCTTGRARRRTEVYFQNERRQARPARRQRLAFISSIDRAKGHRGVSTACSPGQPLPFRPVRRRSSAAMQVSSGMRLSRCFLCRVDSSPGVPLFSLSQSRGRSPRPPLTSTPRDWLVLRSWHGTARAGTEQRGRKLGEDHRLHHRSDSQVRPKFIKQWVLSFGKNQKNCPGFCRPHFS